MSFDGSDHGAASTGCPRPSPPGLAAGIPVRLQVRPTFGVQSELSDWLTSDDRARARGQRLRSGRTGRTGISPGSGRCGSASSRGTGLPTGCGPSWRAPGSGPQLQTGGRRPGRMRPAAASLVGVRSRPGRVFANRCVAGPGRGARADRRRAGPTWPGWPIAWRAGIGAWGCHLAGQPDSNRGWLNSLMESLSHNDPIDVALRRADTSNGETGYSSLSYRLVADSRLSETIARFAEHLSHLRDLVVDVPVEIEALLPGTRHLRVRSTPGPLAHIWQMRSATTSSALRRRDPRSHRSGHAGGRRR